MFQGRAGVLVTAVISNSNSHWQRSPVHSLTEATAFTSESPVPVSQLRWSVRVAVASAESAPSHVQLSQAHHWHWTVTTVRVSLARPGQARARQGTTGDGTGRDDSESATSDRHVAHQVKL